MHMLKLALPLAGLLMVGQALAHKASHVMAAGTASAVPGAAHAGLHPAALLDGAGGRSTRAVPPLAGLKPLNPSPEKHLYTRTH